MIQKNAYSLQGRTALITGAGSGIGFAMAECMIANGARVIVVDLDAERARIAAEQLGPLACWSQFDVGHTNQTEQWVEGVIGEYGAIDILVNNAGNHCKKAIEAMTIADFASVLDVHVVGAFALTKALVPQMREHGRGCILFTASMASLIGIPYVAGYSAAKSALVGLVRGLATELAPAGIRVNGIAPGWIDTPMVRKAMEGDDERRNKILGRTPLKRFGTPEDVGWAASYLASDAAKYVTGHVLVVDGGTSIGF